MNIWNYLDYREYLKNYYVEKKKRQPTFSYRIFSLKTGVQSPNYLKLIIDGERNLTRTHAKQVAKFCALTSDEAEYFFALVSWNQSKSIEEKDILWKEVLRNRRDGETSPIQNWQLSLLSSWHAIVLLELARVKNFQLNAEWVSKNLRVKITPQEIEDAFRTLQEAKLIEIQEKKVKVLSKNLKTGDDIPSACIRKFHREVIREGLSALEEIPVAQREYISTTIAIPESEIIRVKEEIRNFRNQLLKTLGTVDGAEKVYQLNIQFFPLTKVENQ